ncbi:MAG: hypothetical protein WC132_04425 [Methanomethylophilus sp.]
MHCKDVSIREVGCELTRESIGKLMSDWKTYTRTEDLVLSHGGAYAVVHVEKADGKELFRRVCRYDIISLPENTVYAERPDFDVLNVPSMAKLQDEFPGKTIVVMGMFSHVNVVSGIVPVRLRVLDIVPPFPSKLEVLVQKALDSDFVDVPVIAEKVSMDIRDTADGVATEGVMYPCRVCGMAAKKQQYFLDETPDIKCDVTLVGCRLSKRIFNEVYAKDVPFINICPVDHVPDDGKMTIVKCCKIKSGHTVNGKVICVPWGVTVPEIADALNEVFGEMR